MIRISQLDARRFLLRKHGLLGPHRFCGKEGALAFVRQCGCIQFDLVDVCGKNAELTLQSRVKGFSKTMLFDLLYQDRQLVDYPDKQLAIIPVEDWPCFERYRKAALSAMEKLVRAGKIFEVNTGAISRGYRTTPYPSHELLGALHEMGGKITVSADAHHVSGVVCAFDQAEALVRRCGFKDVWVLTKDGFRPQAL